MLEDEKYIKSYDGELIYAKEYCVDNPKGTIILTTDIKEYSLLYSDFAISMQQKGYNVFTYDLRAHKNSAKEPFGTYTNNFFNDCVRDLLYLNKYLSKKYNTETINIGVGIGAVILTRMLQFYHEKSKNILVGSPYSLINFENYILRAITRLTLVFFNKQSEAKLINKYLNWKYQRKFEEGSYISTNKKYIEKIKDDKFCNFNISANILNSIYIGLTKTFTKNNLLKIDKEHKFLLCSGEYDIVTNFGNSSNSLYKKFKQLKINAEKIIFKDLRHNLLNESNDAFIEYLTKFIEKEEN